MAILKYTQGILDLEIVCGDDFNVNLTCAQDTDVVDVTELVDLRNCQLSGTARLNVDSTVGFDIPIQILDQTEPGNVGQFMMMFDKVFTESFRSNGKPKKFNYDIQVSDALGTVTTFIVGSITFVSDFTTATLPYNRP